MKNITYLEIEIIELLCRLHAFTYEQLLKLTDQFDRDDVLNALKTLLEKEFIRAKIIEIPAAGENKIKPKNCKLAEVRIFFLTFQGRAYVRKKLLSLRRYVCEGRKSVPYRKTLYHDLLIVEALIFLKKYHDVTAIFNEDDLKHWKQNNADLRLIIDEGGHERMLDIEIVVQNNRSHIERKSDDMLFFTPSRCQADIIETVKKVPAIVINLANGNLPKKPDYNDFYDRYNYLVHFFKRHRAGFTASAVATLYDDDRAQMHSILCRLAKDGHIFSRSVHENPGTQLGRRTSLFAADDFDIDDLSDRLFALSVSKAIEKYAEKQLYFHTVDRFNRIIIVTEPLRSAYDVPKRRLLYLDNAKKSLPDEAANFEKLELHPEYRMHNRSFEYANDYRKAEAKRLGLDR